MSLVDFCIHSKSHISKIRHTLFEFYDDINIFSEDGGGLRLIDGLFTVLRPAQEFFTYMKTSPLPMKGCKI
jgi:hypothetical protein